MDWRGFEKADKRGSFEDLIYSKKKARRAIGSGQEIISLKKFLQEDIQQSTKVFEGCSSRR